MGIIRINKIIGTCIMLLISQAGISSVLAHPLKVEYKLSVAGIPVGKVKLFGTFNATDYIMEASLKLTGLAGVFVDGKGTAAAAGKITPQAILPSHFSANGTIEKEDQTILVGFTNGTAQTLQLLPPVKNLNKRVPVTEDHKKKVLDPLSAFFAPILSGKDAFDPANCRQDIPVFDGSSRHTISMSYKGVKDSKLSAYTGKVLVCSIRYTPVAGHRTNHKSIKYMADNKDIWVRYAPVKNTNILIPVRLHVATPFGKAEATVSEFTYR